MKRPKKIQGEQLANATRHEVFDELIAEAPHQKGTQETSALRNAQKDK